MLLPAGGCCTCSTAPTPSLAWGQESPVLLGALNQGCASAGPGRRPPVRVDIPCIAVVVPGQAMALPGSTRATAPRSGPKIVTGTVPCPQPGPAHSPALWSGLIPEEILSQQPGFPEREGALLMMPGIIPTAWRCRLRPGHKTPGHSLLLTDGALVEFWGS